MVGRDRRPGQAVFGALSCLASAPKPDCASAYQVKVTNTGTAAEPRAIVHVDLARGLWPVRAGGAGWTCRADFFRDTETCVHATPLAPGQPTTFLVQTLVLARPGTVLTSTADVTPADAHASDTTRVQL